MKFFTSLRTSWKREGEKLKQMTLRQKAEYLREYYMLPLFITAASFILVISVFSAMFSNRFGTAFSCVILNSHSNPGTERLTEEFKDRFYQSAGLDRRQAVSIDSAVSLSFGDSQTPFEYAQMAKLSAMIAAQDLDIIIGDFASTDYYAGAGALADFKELLSGPLYDNLSGDFYYAPGENGIMIACGIKLDGAVLENTLGLSMDRPVLTILANSTRTNRCLAFLKCLLGLPAETPAS